MISSIFRRDRAPRDRRAFTLLEILLVLALMSVLLVGVSSIVRLFSRNYTANERRVGRAQLARSISQMLSDDLGAAVQDPILDVGNDPNREFVRHFGLRGDSRSLQIDVVQPSSFTPTADVDENRRVMSGGEKKAGMRQVPELKTIFYEFVPINSVQKFPGEDEETTEATLQSQESGADLGSNLSGSLSAFADETQYLPNTGTNSSTPLYWDGMRPLTQKFGLSRRELDYETPEDEEENEDAFSAFGGDEDLDVSAQSQLAGSLSSTPDKSTSTLSGSSSGTDSYFDMTFDPSSSWSFDPPMSAAQIAMDSDDGTTWAPEVLDCRFSYFDGKEWFSSWDSLEQNGLPVAIKVELKLAPLDDVDLYRASPLLLSLPYAPSVETLASLEKQAAGSSGDSGVNSSFMAGSLAATPGTAAAGEPVDVFNSYRTPDAVLRALRGIPKTTSHLAANDANTPNQATPQLEDLANDEIDESQPASLLGGLSLTGDASTSVANGAGAFSGEGTTQDASSFLTTAQEMASGGVVYNETGVCVDFMNSGEYATLELMASELGVSEPSYYEVVAYLPTTPFARAKTIERRVPVAATRGIVANSRGRGSATTRTRGSGTNPYATGSARTPRERQARTRVAAERTIVENRAVDRQASTRSATSRGAASRNAANRETQGRIETGRASADRTAQVRATRERAGFNRAQNDVPVDMPVGEPLDGVVGESTVFTPDLTGDIPATVADTSAGASTPGVGGGLGTSGAVASDMGSDAFAVLGTDPAGSVPYSDGLFSAVDAANDSLAPGLVADPSGRGSVLTPDPTTPRQSSGQKQTWIRGKK
ncbi:MAG: prepilin-type N-terminal cleavage/methylation domain-containing protein [Thermoguttaceae bacterium]